MQHPAFDDLLALPHNHPYRAFAEDRYAPAGEIDPEIWAVARPLVAELLAKDPHLNASADGRSWRSRRSVISRYCYALAADDPDLLEPAVALSEDEIVRMLELRTTIDRDAYSSRTSAASVLRSLRASYPRSFWVPPKLTGCPNATEPPIEDDDFELALAACESMREPTRTNCLGMLLASRAAGLDGSDLRWCTGDHVVRIDGVTWVNVDWGDYPRRIPVLARYGARLAALAATRGPRLLVSDTPAPCHTSQAGHVGKMLRRQAQPVTVSPARLRRAWLRELVELEPHLQVAMHVAGVRSLSTFERLINEHMSGRPLPDDEVIARRCGGV